MSNESQNRLNKDQEEEKLLMYYRDILAGTLPASPETQKKFILQLLNTKITQLEPKTTHCKYLHYVLKIVTMVLSGLSTVILGLKLSTPLLAHDDLALICTAIVTFLASLATFWDIENYWIRNKIMLNRLKELRYEYTFFLAGGQSEINSELKGYLNKFLATMGDEYWEKFLKNLRNDNGQ